MSHTQISILSGPKGSAFSITLQVSSEIVGFTQVRNKKYMPFQGKNSIKLEVEKAFVIMIPWVTKQMKCSVSSLTPFYSGHSNTLQSPSAKYPKASHRPFSWRPGLALSRLPGGRVPLKGFVNKAFIIISKAQKCASLG